MLPLYLMSLHEISKREERTMALCVKKPRGTSPWDEQTATTAASPSTSTPPSATGASNDNAVFSIGLIRLLRRLWREFNFDGNLLWRRNCLYSSAALQFCIRIGLFEQCNGTRLHPDAAKTSGLSQRKRKGDVLFGHRIRYGLQSENSSNQQRWLQLRKYWRHNVRQRSQQIERNQHIEQFSVDLRITNESVPVISSFNHPAPVKSTNGIECTYCCTNGYNNNFYDIVRRYRCQNSEKLLWRNFRLVEFLCNSTSQLLQQQQPLQQNYLSSSKEWSWYSYGQQLQFSPRTTFQYPYETTQGQSNKFPAESSKISPRSNFTHANTSVQFLQRHIVVVSPLFKPSDQLYFSTTRRNTRRRTICDSLSPIFLARFKKCLPNKETACVPERTRPSLCLLQSTTLVSHPRHRIGVNSISPPNDEKIRRRKFGERCKFINRSRQGWKKIYRCTTASLRISNH
ncbi:hypothetical protein DOY81_006428 [Sarcophaga bullata]|nr:hypothetical protein DOY81_006428 [Sarcophaga bullata]